MQIWATLKSYVDIAVLCVEKQKTTKNYPTLNGDSCVDKTPTADTATLMEECFCHVANAIWRGDGLIYTSNAMVIQLRRCRAPVLPPPTPKGGILLSV